MKAEVTAITSFRITTVQPKRLAQFYKDLGFTAGDCQSIPDDEIRLLGLAKGGTRETLWLGNQSIALDTFHRPGRPYPADSGSADLCFQHFALVTDNAEVAWLRAARLGAVPISNGGPVKLPSSAGGVTAIKFRDPEGHPLELLQFPLGRRNQWHGQGLLGIDHSAISVSNAAASRRFYTAFGLSLQCPTLNKGPTQMALDGLAGVEVEVLPMIPGAQTPHLELLAYRIPVGRPAGRLEPNDIAGTRIVWAADCDAFVRDPDGHLHQFVRSKNECVSAGGAKRVGRAAA